MTDEQAQTLIDLLPPSARFWVLTVLQGVAILSMLVPLFERLAKLTKSDKDDQVLTVVQRVLSMFPRMQVPALSQRPPAKHPNIPPAPDKLEVTNWPTPEQLAAPKLPPELPPKG